MAKDMDSGPGGFKNYICLPLESRNKMNIPNAVSNSVTERWLDIIPLI